MKKILFLLAICLFVPTIYLPSGTAWALTLTGTITDAITGDDIEIVNITLKEIPQDPSDNLGYTIREFEKAREGDKIIFKHETHTDFIGEITDDNQGGIKVYQFGEWLGSQLFDLKMIENDEGENVWDGETLIFNIKMLTNPVPIITGQVTDEEGNGLWGVRVRSTSPDLHHYSYEATTNEDGSYEIKGPLGSSDNPQNYYLKFHHYDYKDPYDLKVEVKDSIMPNQDMQLTEISVAKDIQNNMTDTSGGFECDELMPKYLIGADCISNQKLKGDARDITMWIQKFGGKITGLIGMIAVVLIVWNAFNITTAAGDSEQISQGKKGIIWTIVGLGLTMFAYVIVKTIIMLTYTQ